MKNEGIPTLVVPARVVPARVARVCSASREKALLLALLIWLLAAAVTAKQEGPTTALYLDRTVEIERTLDDPTDLWVTPEDLTRVNDFVLKPEGACLAELCIPINQSEGSDIVLRRGDEAWFSLTAFAERVGQEFVVDREARVWSFGTIPVTRSSFLDRAQAPDFALPDREGNLVRLSDFRGKKVLILSWASW